jgi:hypothetical protein
MSVKEKHGGSQKYGYIVVEIFRAIGQSEEEAAMLDKRAFITGGGILANKAKKKRKHDIAYLSPQAQLHRLHSITTLLIQSTCPQMHRCCHSPCTPLATKNDQLRVSMRACIPSNPYCLVGYSGRRPSKSPPLHLHCESNLREMHVKRSTWNVGAAKRARHRVGR